MKIIKVMPYEVLEKTNWSINALISFSDIEKTGLPLSELVDFNPEKVSKKKDISPGQVYPYIDLSCVSSEKGIITDYKSFQGEDLPSRATLRVKEGDLILSTVRPERNLVAVIDKHLSGSIINSTFTVLRPKKGEELSPLLYFTLRSNEFQDILHSIATGSTVPTIKLKDLRSVKLPIETIEDSLVNEAYSLHEKWISKQSHKRSFRELIEDIFDGYRKSEDKEYVSSESLIKVLPYNELQNRLDVGFYTTPSMETQWDFSTFKLGELVSDFRSGAAIPSKEYQEEGIPYIRIKDLKNGSISVDNAVYVNQDFATINVDDKAFLNHEDVVISRVGTVGKAALVTKEIEGSVINQHITIVNVNKMKISPEYFNYYMQTPWAIEQLEQRASGTAQQFIRLKDIKDLTVPVPTLEKQEEIVSSIKKQLQLNSDEDIQEEIIAFTEKLLQKDGARD